MFKFPLKTLELRRNQIFRNENELVAWILNKCTDVRMVWYLNPHTFNYFAAKKTSLSSMTAIVADGNYTATLLQSELGEECRSLNFDFSGCANTVLESLAKNSMRLGVVGGSEADIRVFSGFIKERVPELNLVFVQSGYFELSQQKKVISRMMRSKPDVIIVSMGSPRQEVFCEQVYSEINDDSTVKLITCGAFVSQVASGGEAYFPPLVTRMRLRWLFRMVKEKRVLLRVIKYYIPFVVAALILKFKPIRIKN